jgi:DNA-binding transcriptional MerR regulator
MGLTIQQVRGRFDVTARALRFYEDQGLLAPERRGTSRIYNEEQVERITFILRMRDCGFPISEIRDLIGRRHSRATILRALRGRVPVELDAAESLENRLSLLTLEIALLEQKTSRKDA